MKLTIEVPETNVMTTGDLRGFLLRSMDWTACEAGDNTPASGFRFRENSGNRRFGEYDMVEDEITWDGGAATSLFRCDSPDYCGESLAEMLDATALFWCEDEDENTVLFVER